MVSAMIKFSLIIKASTESYFLRSEPVNGQNQTTPL